MDAVDEVYGTLTSSVPTDVLIAEMRGRPRADRGSDRHDPYQHGDGD